MPSAASLPSRLSDLYRHIKRDLWAAGVASADLDSRIIITTNTGYEWADIIARDDDQVPQELLEKIASHVRRRKDGEPVSRIFGERQFWGLDFEICQDTLDPRQDSETLIDAVLKRFSGNPPQTILDLGTGSGCLLVALLHEFKDSQGVGVDKSIDAVQMAIKNAQTHNVADRAQFFCGSWAHALNQKFDLIISNPPYIPNQVIKTLSKEVQNHDPILALDGGEDGLEAYKNILSEISSHLNDAGAVFFEIGYNQGEEVMRLVEDSGFTVEGLHYDLASKPRVVEISNGDK